MRRSNIKLIAGAAGSYPSNATLGGEVLFGRRGPITTTATLVGVLVAVLMLAAPARAQIALVDNELTTASTFSDTSTALLLATNLTVSAAANTLVVEVTFRNASSSQTEAPATLGWTNGTVTQTLTLIVQNGSKAANGGRNSAIYYLYNPTAGTGFNISGKLSGQSGSSGSSGALVAYTLSGVDTTIATPPSGSASATGPDGASFLSFIVGGITANSWAAVGGDLAAASGIPITATNSGVATGTPDLTTTTGGFSSTTTASLGCLSAIAGGSDTFTMIAGTADCAFAAAVFSPPLTSSPAISSQPQSELIYPGVGVTGQFTVQASGQAPLNCQWYVTGSSAGALTAGEFLTNGVALADGSKYHGSTSLTLSISNVVAGDLTNYAVIITNSMGSITSSIASLAAAPVVNQPSNVISVNFTFTTAYDSTAVTLAPSDIAGAVPVTNWNNYVANSSWPSTQGTGNLQDNTGANTGAGLTMSGVENGWYNTASTITSASTPNAKLLYNALILKSGNTDTYTFTNLPAVGNYDVYVYLCGQDTTDLVQVQCPNSGVTYYQTELGQAITNDQALVPGNNTTSGIYPNCNYVVFSGVTPFAKAIALVVPQSGSSVNAGVAGVQLVPSGTTFLGFMQQPQPATTPTGQNATFSVSVAGNPAASSYQWYQIIGGVTNLIAGANASSYTATAATAGAGYFVVVGNGGATVTSSVAELSLYLSTTAPHITTAVTGGGVSLSWPLDHTGWMLQAQTNGLAAGFSTNWINVTNSATTNRMVLPPNPGNGCAFYRLVYPVTPIDRYALVTRHIIQWNSSSDTIPLGNGEFGFNADGTGLETFGGNTMAHWAWHSFPLPSGVTAAEIPATGTFETGRVAGQDIPPGGTLTNSIETWMKQNPHVMDLGRLQLCDATGTALTSGAISGLVRTMNIWSGVQTSSYQVSGQTVSVTTCVHPALDAVAVRIQSPLVASGALQVSLDFPYPSTSGNSWLGSFSQTSSNTTTMTLNGGSRADFARTLDTTNYNVSLAWSSGGQIATVGGSWPNRFLLSAPGNSTLEFICVFSNAPVTGVLPSVTQSLMDTTNHWTNFWSTGGAIDLSGSADSRWFELERRIVLSEYQEAAQNVGDWQGSEVGLMGIDLWEGQFHMEMTWWHLTHYALWNRWAMMTNALPYQRFIPQAQALAAQLDYKGMKWLKEVGPQGRTVPWVNNQILLWKQPHPIFFAELDYRLHPTQATLVNWSNIVFGTADNMADYPDFNASTGIYSLTYDVPPSEKLNGNVPWSNTVFDLAYWRWGLNQAQIWRQRLGLARNPVWDQVLTNLAPLPVLNGVFVDYAGDTTTYTTTANSHPDPIGVYGMLPPIDGVDTNIAHSTVLKLWSSWDWSNVWCWDFPWMAMAAARTGETQIAMDALMDGSSRNYYDYRGVNTGGGYPYLVGGEGLLYAVAMMAAGWDGSSGWAPGFPNDGTWTVKWEGLNKAP